MKKLLCILMILTLWAPSVLAEQEDVTYADLISGMITAYQAPSEEATARLDAIAEQMNDSVALCVASHWKAVWLDPDYRLWLDGTDDPALLPIEGRHAFVVLGYQLKDGGMADELIGRCDTAAEIGRAHV